MRLKDLELPADILADAMRFQDDLGQDDDEFLAEALEIGQNREMNSADGPAPVRFPDDRARIRYGVEFLVDQLRYVEAQADPS